MKSLMVTLIGLVSSAFTAVHAGQNSPETWECTGLSVAALMSKMTVIATTNPGNESGTVSVNGLKYKAEYQLQGFVRIWRIRHEKPLESLDIFVIAPDSSGALYLNVQPDDIEEDSQEDTFLTVVCNQVK